MEQAVNKKNRLIKIKESPKLFLNRIKNRIKRGNN